MKVLLYNFVQPEQRKRGGGVAIYQANLAGALKAAGHEVVLMSAGTRHSLRRRSPRIVPHRDEYDRAEVIDSPVVAPAIYSFFDLGTYNDDTGLDSLPAAIREQFGEIDVFHFQNIEGLTRLFFYSLRKAYPRAKLILSVHNYNIICPEVHLWFEGKTVCEDYRSGFSCTQCQPFSHPHTFNREVLIAETLMLRTGLRESGIAFKSARRATRLGLRVYRRLSGSGRKGTAGEEGRERRRRTYERFRLGNIALCSEVFDHVLAVSDRTRQVLVQRGMTPGNLSVSYIGTSHKTAYLGAKKVKAAAGGLHLGYLGYMRMDKGFYFFLQCLEEMDAELARPMSVTVAARASDSAAVARLTALDSKFKSVVLHDGYAAHDFDEVIKGVNLGVVPVLWEDNLPQVAIELVSRGIPILTSDRGGAREIAHNDAFCFPSGSVQGFHEKLAQIQSGRTSLATFWNREPALYSMNEHVAELMRYYEPAS